MSEVKYEHVPHGLYFSEFGIPTHIGSIASPFIWLAAPTGKAANPDLFTFEEAMKDENKDKWIEAARKEIKTLKDLGCWEEVPRSEAKTKILPGTWAFRQKRTPDGEIYKFKGRYCVRGDLQEGDFDTFAPVVAWSTVRMFLVLCLTLGWTTISVDFDSAFVQASLDEPVWIDIPRGFMSYKNGPTCLRLKRSLYGLSLAPKLFYLHCLKALKAEGFVPSKYDPCLLMRDGMLIVMYVDDLAIGSRNEKEIHTLIANLKKKGFSLSIEGNFTTYLGIKLEKNDDGSVHLSQKFLIDKIIAATGMERCNQNWTPTTQTALGQDPDGEPMEETWSYPSVVGMLLYLSTNTRPDISFAVSQVARCSSSPKKSHATAIKSIVRYLARTSTFGTIMKPDGTLRVDCFVDADFAGLFKADPDHEPTAARSRTGYIIKIGGCPVIWKSQLQTATALSTMEAEYNALSTAMTTVLPMKRMLQEVAEFLGVPAEMKATIHATVFEDNMGAYLLATNQRITNRTKYYLTKFHHFWEHVGVDADVEKCDTKLMDADYLTKGLVRVLYEGNRKRVQGW